MQRRTRSRFERLDAILDPAGLAQRNAAFVLALAFTTGRATRCLPADPVEHLLEIRFRGGRGFGYDPIFRLPAAELTFGEMDPDEKHAVGHRAATFEKLKAALL